MKQSIRAVAAILCCLLLCCCTKNLTRTEAAAEGCKALLRVRGDLLSQEELLPAGSSSADWLAIALTLGGVEDAQEAYLASLEQYVTECYTQQGTLSERKATEYHRIALTVQALGGDPTAFGTHRDGSPVNLIEDGTYGYPGDLEEQGLNGLIYALITLNSGNFGTEEQRQAILLRILAAQTPEGGFSLADGPADVDITAMSIQALAPYREACAKEIDAALDWLSRQMTPRCTFNTYGSECAESICQVVIALCALGIDPEQDVRFLRAEHTLLTALDGFEMEDGSFRHCAEDSAGNLSATQQAMLAFAALDRFRIEGRSLYDFS